MEKTKRELIEEWWNLQHAMEQHVKEWADRSDKMNFFSNFTLWVSKVVKLLSNTEEEQNLIYEEIIEDMKAIKDFLRKDNE